MKPEYEQFCKRADESEAVRVQKRLDNLTAIRKLAEVAGIPVTDVMDKIVTESTYHITMLTNELSTMLGVMKALAVDETVDDMNKRQIRVILYTTGRRLAGDTHEEMFSNMPEDMKNNISVSVIEGEM